MQQKEKRIESIFPKKGIIFKTNELFGHYFKSTTISKQKHTHKHTRYIIVQLLKSNVSFLY